ncbi:MAG TPA: DUF1080 domain-containing protein [Verrucomicrobiae bacterium]
MKSIAVFFLLTATIVLAQDSDLTYPPERIHEMSVALFNQKDFTGWTFCLKDNAAPLKTWSVTNGIIHCTGKPTGYLRTTGVYSNYFLTVVWRFVKIAPQADNTGILVHIQPGDKVWPQCVQVQGKHGRQGDLFLMEGAEAKEHKGKDKNTPVPLQGDSVEVPVGEWNKAETICVNGKVESFMNSKFVNEITECTVNSGYIGIQSEGGEIEIRSIDYCPLKY